jgi:hypothetical protein
MLFNDIYLLSLDLIKLHLSFFDNGFSGICGLELDSVDLHYLPPHLFFSMSLDLVDPYINITN